MCAADMRTTERLIDLLRTVNATAIDNDGGKPGELLAEICHEAAQRLRELDAHNKVRMEQISEFLNAHGYSHDHSEPDIMDNSFEDGNRGC